MKQVKGLEKELSGTIENFIDMFIVNDKDKEWHIIYEKDKITNSNMSFERALEDETIMDKSDIYGAIWTDKGLIYFAKMNDKKEWELL